MKQIPFFRHLLVASLAAPLFFGGCKKKKTEPTPEPGPASAAAGSTTMAGSAAGSAPAGSAAGSAAAGSAADVVEPAKTCSATAWKEKSGLFCVDAPDFKAGKPEDYLDGDGWRIYFKREAKDDKPELMFQVTWRKKLDVDASVEAVGLAGSMESDCKNNTCEEQGKYHGGKGRYVVFARKDDDKSHKMYAVVQGNKHAYSCEASSYEKPIAPEQIAGCKSLIPTD